jgi:hypothetical protein
VHVQCGLLTVQVNKAEILLHTGHHATFGIKMWC